MLFTGRVKNDERYDNPERVVNDVGHDVTDGVRNDMRPVVPKRGRNDAANDVTDRVRSVVGHDVTR
jgi:hypothetical protein